MAQPRAPSAVLHGVPPRRAAAERHREVHEVKKLKKAVVITVIAGGLAVAGAGAAAANSADAHGKAVGSPGVAAGNLVQAPVHIPANVVGDTVSVIGVLNPAFGDHALNF
jgi:hypothetical protein